MITRDYVKPGATVIDVGMNQVTERAEFERLFAGNAKREESFRAKGSTLVGDVHPEVAADRGGNYAGSRRSRAADHRHADGEYRARPRSCAAATACGNVTDMNTLHHGGSLRLRSGQARTQRKQGIPLNLLCASVPLW